MDIECMFVEINLHKNKRLIVNERFRTELNTNLSIYDLNNIDYDVLECVFMSLFDRHAPLKLNTLEPMKVHL